MTKKILSFVGFFLLLVMSVSLAQTTPRTALLLNIKNTISPAMQDFIHRGLTQAASEHAEIVILQIDTPGGLDKSMRGIISDILASSVPVIVYVAPSGARAASAGTYILYASNIAAMAPGTNLGAASPVSIGANNEAKKETVEDKKVKQDAMAYIRGLAQLRGRNVAWAAQAVNNAVSLSANEALQQKVIDVVAKNIPDLLTQINGRNVTIQNVNKTINTVGLTVTEFKPDWRTRFLSIITDPSVAYILMMVGIWGLFFEFANPGMVLPGVAGTICLLLAMYAFQLLPINFVGMALILLGIAFFIAEAFIASFGVLGIGGVIALVMGSVLLMEKGTPGFQIAWQLILAVSIATAAFFFLIINIALKARFRPIVSGREELIGVTGIVTIDDQGIIFARVLGEMWQVKSDVALKNGDKIKVIAVQGLTLKVERSHPQSPER